MSSQIEVMVIDHDSVEIQGVLLSDPLEIQEKIRNLVAQAPTCSLLIIPVEERFYRAISKVVYAAAQTGIGLDRLFYKPSDGSAVLITELEAVPKVLGPAPKT